MTEFTPKQIAAHRAFAPQLFTYLDEQAQTMADSTYLYQKAHDVVGEVKRKGVMRVTWDFIAAQFADREAIKLLYDDCYRRTPGGKRHYGEVDKLVAIYKAAALTGAWLLGLKVGATRIEPSDDLWLRDPTFPGGETGSFVAAYWAACCIHLGLRCVEDMLNDYSLDDNPLNDETEFWDICDCRELDRDENIPALQARAGDTLDIAGFIDYANLLATAVMSSGAFRALSQALIAKRVLSEAEVSRIMFEHDLVTGSISVCDTRNGGREVGLDYALNLSFEAGEVYLKRKDYGFADSIGHKGHRALVC